MKIWYILKLTRPVNLFIIAVTMFVFHDLLATAIEQPDLTHAGMQVGFLVLVASTLVIAAAGNMINDYFDIRIDRINKPESIIIGKYVKRREAMLLHVVMNTLAVIAGLFLWWRYGTWIPAVVHVFTTSTLWLYSVTLKKRFLIGNLAISLLTALVPLIVFWYEAPLIYKASSVSTLHDIKQVFYLYAGFAFLTSLIREIQKDYADMEGDRAHGCKTVPVILPGTSGRLLLLSFMLILVSCLVIAVVLNFAILSTPAAWALPMIGFPLLLSMFLSWSAQKRETWLLAGNLMKLVMLGGIFLLGILVYGI